MRLSRDHHDALEAHVDTLMARANRGCFLALAVYGAVFALFCWGLS